MRCPFCDADNSKVIDSRPYSEGHSIKRRRECVSCGLRFNTYERVEEIPFYVIKSDGKRELFDKNKILRGLLRATEKRNIKREDIDKFVAEIEKEIQNNLKGELRTQVLGELIMKKLKTLDEVAYVRFASVYKRFNDLESFVSEIKEISKK